MAFEFQKLVESGTVRLRNDIRDRLAERGWPAIVIHIPGRDELLSNAGESPKVREFARILNARFIDGSHPFRSLTQDEIRACYFPVDGHWNQAGSDRFGTFVSERLK